MFGPNRGPRGNPGYRNEGMMDVYQGNGNNNSWGNDYGNFGGGSWNQAENWNNRLVPPFRVNCGELRRQDVGKVVEMAGKVHKISRERFIQLKDNYGITQLVIPLDRMDLQKRFAKMPLTSFIAVLGQVQGRPGRGHNERMQTGEIEVIVREVLAVRVSKGEKRWPAAIEGAREPPSSANPPKITSDEYIRFHPYGVIPQLNERKYTIADLPYMVDQKVSVYCWVERATKKFLFVIDGYSKVQAVVPDKNETLVVTVESLSQNDIILVQGTVRKRPEAQVNSNSVNGHIELQLEAIDWLQPQDDPDVQMKDSLLESGEKSATSEYSERTHTCGELRVRHAGQSVVLYGWLHYQRLSKFVVLRDGYGFVQCVFSLPDDPVDIKTVPLESVVRVEGTVVMRPPCTIHEDSSTGEVEVLIKKLTVVNMNELNNKIAIANDETLAQENVRLENRFTDLRSKKMQNNLRMRSKFLQSVRNTLIDRFGFVEVETPALFARTLQDKVEYLVQTKESQMFYALVPSLQVPSQLLIAGGLDRVFQLGKCFREEPSNAETQPEFTALHVELAVARGEHVMALTEQLLALTFPGALPRAPFPRITHRAALALYGTAAPTPHPRLKFTDVRCAFDKSAQGEGEFSAYALALPRHAHTAKSEEAVLKSKAKHTKANVVTDVSTLPAECADAVREAARPADDETLYLAFGDHTEVCGAMREIHRWLSKEVREVGAGAAAGGSGQLRAFWLTEAPLFAREPSGALKYAGHPFAKTLDQDRDLLATDASKVRCDSFDLVVEGCKWGGGAVRAHCTRELHAQLAALGSPGAVPYLARALSSGCPPHAGIALGVDRVLKVACEAASIRDVMALPKAYDGRDLLTGAPFREPAERLHDSGEPSAKMLKLE